MICALNFFTVKTKRGIMSKSNLSLERPRDLYKKKTGTRCGTNCSISRQSTRNYATKILQLFTIWLENHRFKLEQKIGTESPCAGSILFRSDPMLIFLSRNPPSSSLMNSSTILRENLRWRRNYSQRTVYYKNHNPITEMKYFKLFSKKFSF